jgi:hypothetical protein
MTRQSLAAFRRVITVDWPRATEAEAKSFLIKTATEGNEKTLREQTAREGVRPGVTSYANTPGNRDIRNVKLPGPIVHQYDYRREIVEVGLGALIKASPVQKGEYVQNHHVYVDGVRVDALPERLPEAAEVMISNPVPYSRRIEIGKTKSGRDFVLQVPNRIYERVAKQVLARRYGNVAKITFGYVELPDAHVTKGKLSSHYGTGKAPGRRGGGVMRKRQQKPGTKVRAPAIFIEAL